MADSQTPAASQGMAYADTRVTQRVVVIANRSYPSTYVGRTGMIVRRYDGIGGDHGTVEVRLDGESYFPPPLGWMYFTHMGADQIAPAGEGDPTGPEA